MFVMPGLVPGIHVFKPNGKTWMAGTSPAMTSHIWSFLCRNDVKVPNQAARRSIWAMFFAASLVTLSDMSAIRWPLSTALSTDSRTKSL